MSAKKKNIHQEAVPSPHDTFVKEILSRKENARDFFSHYLPEHILSLVDLDSLEIAKDSFIEKELSEYFSDLLYQLRLSGFRSDIPQGSQAGYVYVLFEHKSFPERWIAFHLLRYQVKIWELFLKQHKRARRLPVIVPLVLYHGTRHWRAGMKFSDLIEGPREELKAYIPDFSYLFYDFSPYGNNQIEGAAILRVLLLLLKYIHHPELATYLRQILPLLKELAPQHQELITYLETIIRYIFNATDRVSVDELKKIVETSLANDIDEEGMIMTLAEQLIQKGREEGLHQGMERGLHQGMERGIQESVIEVLEARFGAVPASIKKRLTSITDRAILEDLLKKAATAFTLPEWEKNVLRK